MRKYSAISMFSNIKNDIRYTGIGDKLSISLSFITIILPKKVVENEAGFVDEGMIYKVKE